MMNNLTAPSKTNLTNRQQTAQLSLAAMQADMADMRAALKNKQRASVVQKENIERYKEILLNELSRVSTLLA